MDFIKLSIIIPVYNNFKQLEKCLASLTKQKFKGNYEVIVVDDGSEQTLPSIGRGQLKGVKFYRIGHKGAPAARNFGFSKSKGKYLFFCDADVVFLDKYALQKMVDALENNPDKAFCYSAFKYGWKKFPCGPFDAGRLRQNNYISGMSLIRREYFPGWDESLKKFQDWDLWLTIMEHGGQGIFIPEILWQCKVGGTMSKWLPRFLYKLKFLKSVKEFEKAKSIIKKKHNL